MCFLFLADLGSCSQEPDNLKSSLWHASCSDCGLPNREAESWTVTTLCVQSRFRKDSEQPCRCGNNHSCPIWNNIARHLSHKVRSRSAGIRFCIKTNKNNTFWNYCLILALRCERCASSWEHMSKNGVCVSNMFARAHVSKNETRNHRSRRTPCDRKHQHVSNKLLESGSLEKPPGDLQILTNKSQSVNKCSQSMKTQERTQWSWSVKTCPYPWKCITKQSGVKAYGKSHKK